MSAPQEGNPVDLDARFVIVPQWLLDTGLPSRAIHVYALLWQCAAADTRAAWPSRRWLADRCGSSASGIDRAVRQLLAAGAITRRQRWDESGSQRSSVYIVRQAPPSSQVTTPLTTGGDPLPSPRVTTPLTTGDKGPSPRVVQRTRPSELDTSKTSETATERARPVACEHGDPRGLAGCALCRHAPRRAPQPQSGPDDEPYTDHALLAAGDVHHREDDDR